MREVDCDELLQWAMPRMGLQWSAFRRVKRQVCRRVRIRARELGLTDAHAFAQYLEQHPEEWPALEALCGITISRFYRDRPVFECIRLLVLPAIARELPAGEALRVWSAGCASGEEPYSIALLWQLELAAQFPGRELQVLATDRDPQLLGRAVAGCYRSSSLRELPRDWIARGFVNTGDRWCLDATLRRCVTFERSDLRRAAPAGPFDLILCRNLAFSYFEPPEQRAVLRGFHARLRPHGRLAIGLRETLPDGSEGFEPETQSPYVFRRVPLA